jgi:hypothetical protein
VATTIPQTQVAKAPRASASVASRAASVPVAALSVIVGASIALHVTLALWVPAPWIFADELEYSELAKSFAASGHFALRGVPGIGLGPVYPLLIAPVYAVFHNLGDAWIAAKVVNAVLMSLAAVPAYFLARRLVSQRWALAASGLTVVVPSTLYVSTITTESAFYPLFLCVALAIVRVLERPTPGRQVTTLALIGLACLTRAQAVALLAAYPTAVLAFAAVSGRGFVRRLSRFWPSLAALGGAVVAVAVWESLHGRSLFAALGNAQGVQSRTYSVGAVAKWFAFHVAELDLYVGVLPFAAFLVLAVWAARRPDREILIFTATALSLGFWLLLTVAAYTSNLSKYDAHSRSHVFDRYTFYLAPLVLIALCAWASRRVHLSTRGTVIVAGVAGALALALPYDTLISDDSVPDTVGFLPWVVNSGGAIVARPNVLGFVLVLTLCLSALFFLMRRGQLAYLAPVVVFLWLFSTLLIAERWYHVEGAAAKASGSDRAWVDHALGPNGKAIAIWSGTRSPHLIWETEFFNRSVGAVYYLREPTWAGLPEQRLSVRRKSGLVVDQAGRPFRARYALVDPWVVLRGRVVARDRASGMRLYRLSGSIVRIGSN